MTLTLLASRMACAQEKEPPANHGRARGGTSGHANTELVNLSDKMRGRCSLAIQTFFNAAYSDDFSGVNWYGEVLNKAKQIRAIQTSTVHL